MVGISDLKVLLGSMNPELIDCEYIFSTISEKDLSLLRIKPLLLFRENEGITIIVKKEDADNSSIPYDTLWSLITLNVHSDLQAVGFLAVITKELAKEKISVNVVSAFYHDHLFVPVNKAEKAMEVLKNLSKELKLDL